MDGGQTNTQTRVKQYAPNPSIQGYKNSQIATYFDPRHSLHSLAWLDTFSRYFTSSVTLNHTILILMTLQNKPFENIVRKGKMLVISIFFFFPQCFLPIPKRISFTKLNLFCHLQMLSIWTSLK